MTMEECKFETVLKHIIFDNEENEFYSYLPDNHVIITDKNNNHKTIKKTKIKLNTLDCVLKIGNIYFNCSLYTRAIDDKVLLSIHYEDNLHQRLVTNKHLSKLAQYVEIQILGYEKHYPDYEQNPDVFFGIHKENEQEKWEISDGAW